MARITGRWLTGSQDNLSETHPEPGSAADAGWHQRKGRRHLSNKGTTGIPAYAHARPGPPNGRNIVPCPVNRGGAMPTERNVTEAGDGNRHCWPQPAVARLTFVRIAV